MPKQPRVSADDTRQLRPRLPARQQLEVALQFNLKLHTFLDSFDILDYVAGDDVLRDAITDLLQVTYRKEDEGCVVIIEDISFAAGQQEGTRRPPTVVEYFEDKLATGWPYPCDASHPASPAHPDFHIESGCGRDCANAIDAAVEAIRHVKKAFGDDEPELVKGIVEACSATVRCYVYG